LIAVFALVSIVVQGQALQAQETSDSSFREIEGTVRDSSGSPVGGASIRLEQEGVSGALHARTNSAGNFELTLPNLGNYILRIQKPGFSECVVRLPVSQTKPPALNVVLSRSDQQRTSSELQFSDGPDFTVAGVTDWTAAGGHGSDVALRTSEALAKQTRTLEGDDDNRPLNPDGLRKKREQLQAMLANADRADLHHELAETDEQLNDPLAAEHEYERAAQLDPSEDNYFAWGAELLLHRAIQPAREVFAKGSSAYPRSERMLAGLGAALYASGLAAEAAERVCAASDLQPGDPTPYLFLGKMVQASSQPLPCAEEKLARFAHNQPRNAFANYYYALALQKVPGSSERSESLLKTAIQADPKFAEAYVQLGILYSEKKHNAEAITAFQRAVEANPNLAEAHFRLANAYKKAGESAKARREFQTYEQIQKSEAAAVEQQRREIQQFVVVFKNQSQPAQQP
jgi:tetratricopeptide (TPR) repeat protein